MVKSSNIPLDLIIVKGFALLTAKSYLAAGPRMTSKNSRIHMSLKRKILISLFIIFNFMGMVRVHLPLDAKFFMMLYRPIDYYLSYFSLYQDWMMFAPNPGRLNVTIQAEIEFDDGSSEKYDFPDPMQLSIFKKYRYGEKMRKILSEGIRKEENSYLWKDTARFVLRQMEQSHFHKIPTKVRLYRIWDEVPNLEKQFRSHSETFTKNQSDQFYTYGVI
jgi:hypothetical protein